MTDRGIVQVMVHVVEIGPRAQPQLLVAACNVTRGRCTNATQRNVRGARRTAYAMLCYAMLCSALLCAALPRSASRTSSASPLTWRVARDQPLHGAAGGASVHRAALHRCICAAAGEGEATHRKRCLSSHLDVHDGRQGDPASLERRCGT